MHPIVATLLTIKNAVSQSLYLINHPISIKNLGGNTNEIGHILCSASVHENGEDASVVCLTWLACIFAASPHDPEYIHRVAHFSMITHSGHDSTQKPENVGNY